MASITVNLGAALTVGNRALWPDNTDIGSIFDADGLGQEISQTSVYGAGANEGRVRLSISGANNRFTPAFEATGRIIYEASDGETLEIRIANADLTEPYLWIPANAAEVIAFADHLNGLTDKTATLTLTDESGGDSAPAFSDDTGDAQAWTQNIAIGPITVPQASGTPTPTYAPVGALPSGIAFDTTTRAISGTPTATGSGTITVRAINSEGSDDWTVDYAVTATPPPPNQSPNANAGSDQSVAAAAMVVLNGSGSSDPDGSIASYAWTQQAGDTVALSGSDTAIASFTAPSTNTAQTLTFQLVVTDNDGATDSATVDVAVAAFVSAITPRAYRVRVDWDGDGLFANPHSDVTSDLFALPKAIRGRNYGDQIYGRSEAGYLEAILRNSDGLYNRFDNTSDLVDLVVPGRLVEFAVRRSGQSTFRTRWSGLLDDVRPIEVQSGRNRVRLTALGPLSLITQTDVSVAAYAHIETDTALGHVFDAADVPAERRGPVNGNRTMARWWSRLQTGMGAARELEETELGFLYETKADAQIAMDAENARLTGAGRTSQFAMTRDGDPGPGEIGLMNPIEFTDPLQDIVNVVTVPIRAFSVGAQETLWESALVPIELATGAEMVFIAEYPNPESPSQRVGIADWTDLAANTDYRAFANANGTGTNRTSSLTLTTTKAGNTLRIEVENGHSGTVYLTLLQARGTPLIEGSTNQH